MVREERDGWMDGRKEGRKEGRGRRDAGMEREEGKAHKRMDGKGSGFKRTKMVTESDSEPVGTVPSSVP